MAQAPGKHLRIPIRSARRRNLIASPLPQVTILSTIADHLFTAGNFFEVLRLSVELGLLAIALAPVIITGGIDLSVGSMMGLAAVAFGAAWHDWNLPLPAAACVALLLGCA